jgi:hypothetical protein
MIPIPEKTDHQKFGSGMPDCQIQDEDKNNLINTKLHFIEFQHVRLICLKIRK